VKAEDAPPHSLLGVAVWAGAPEPVLRWLEKKRLAARELSELGDEANELFERAPSTSALVWILAASGFPLDRVATGLALLLEERASVLGEQALLDTLEIGLGALEDPSLGQSALVHAKKCELLEGRDPRIDGGYRDGTDRWAVVCRGLALFARAAEALGAFVVRERTERTDRARHSANMLGMASIWVGPADQVMLPHERRRPISLARPVAVHLPAPHELVFAADHLARAMTELERLEKPTQLRDALLSELED
jgi:hypothetical protein